MINPSDQDYQDAKKRKKNGTALPSPFRELATWIESTYGVEVLDIQYENDVFPSNLPKINVVLEWKHDSQKFNSPNSVNFDKTKQDNVKKQFESLLIQKGITDFNTTGMFIIFSDFESVAKEEAYRYLFERGDLESLKQKINNPDLWKITTLFSSVTFFFYTDAQARAHKANGGLQKYSEEFFCIIAPYDEFGYIQKSGICASFDSKENFDTNFDGSWFNYYK